MVLPMEIFVRFPVLCIQLVMLDNQIDLCNSILLAFIKFSNYHKYICRLYTHLHIHTSQNSFVQTKLDFSSKSRTVFKDKMVKIILK